MGLAGTRAFVLLWLGQAASLIGAGLTGFAIGVHVFQVTGSVSRFALIELLALGPVALLSPFAGALTDRWDRRRTLIVTDLLAAASPLVLAWCLRGGDAPLWQIGAAAAAMSTLAAFQWPAFSALTTQLVPAEQLGRAAGATEVARAIAQIFSPVLAGLALGGVSIGALLVIDSATHVFSACMMSVLLRVKLAAPSAPREAAGATVLHDIARGWRYLVSRRDLLVLAGFFAFTNLALGIVEICITPLVLSVASPAALGGVLWVAGVGMLLGGLVMSIWRGARRPMHLVLAVTLVQGALLIAAGASRGLASLTVIAFLYLFCFPISMATNHAMWLRAVPVAMQGSVLGLRRLLEGAALPIAALVAGPLVDGLFAPLLAPGGALAGVFGAGPGRAIALMYVALGGVTALVSVIALTRAGRLVAAATTEAGDASADLTATSPSSDAGVPAPQKTSAKEATAMTDAAPGSTARVASTMTGPRARAWHAWLVWAAFFAVVALVIRRPWQDTAVPPAASVPAGAFSAERAWTHLDALAAKLGRRVTGSAACERAADYLEAELRRLGVETERQVDGGTAALDGTTYVYRGVTNVLARIPGKSPRALLVSAHYDSAVEGAGAGDNALGVAAALEIVRALVATGAPAHTILFNFNGAEELGLLGAAAFVKHPWFADVAGFINLDASGGQGRQLLVQVTPGSDELLEAYAASAPHVHGTVLAQEIFRLLPFDTDYHVYRDAGLRGLDLAPYGDGYAYHTALDRPDRVSRRTLQDTGDNVLAILRGLGELPGTRGPGDAAAAPYYDLLGLVMVRYSADTAQIAGMLVALLALFVACWPRMRRKRPIAALALGATSIGASAVLGLLVPIAASLVVTLTGQAMAWFARPWIAVCVYGSFTVAGVLAGQCLLRWLTRRRGLDRDAVAEIVQRGLVVFWAGLLVLTTLLGVGSAYLPLWWCAGSAIALLASLHLRGIRRWVVTLASMAMAAIVTAQAADLLLTSLVPLTGTLGAEAPAEILIAAVTALVLVPFALLLAPVMQASPSLRRVAAGTAVLVLAALGLVAGSFPYTAERPKRVYVDVHAGGEARARVAVEVTDPGPALAITEAPLAAPPARALPIITVLRRASPGASPAPGALDPSGSSGSIVVELQVAAPGAYLVDLQLDGAPGTLSADDAGSRARHLIWVGTKDPLHLQVAKTSAAALVLHVKAYYLEPEPSAKPTLDQLPSWTAPSVQTVLEASATL